ncbi:hypothetical protein SESBI_07655 [Sesbania bispinosa]|nr:hypothetical protein SESBI_07655 [Sesbania bispinosa]
MTNRRHHWCEPRTRPTIAASLPWLIVALLFLPRAKELARFFFFLATEDERGRGWTRTNS